MNHPNRLMEPRDAEVFDVDGTLCVVDSIRHYVTGENRDFHRFHTASQFCPANPDVVAKVHRARELGRAVLVVTSRMARYRLLTRRWLREWDIPFDELKTRPEGDFRKDSLVKLDIVRDLEAMGYRIRKAHDDNPDVVENVWDVLGIECEVVPGWEHQFQEGA